jgi:hypothetical protein
MGAEVLQLRLRYPQENLAGAYSRWLKETGDDPVKDVVGEEFV